MKKSSGGVVAVVRNAILPVVEGLGYSLWDVEYVKEGADMFLRITIDRPEGITIDDCEVVHRAIDPVLDEVDPIEDAYHLEVSSPGLERDLRTEAHFAACTGREIEVRLYAPMDGAKVWTGELLGLSEDGSVRLLTNGAEKQFPKAAVAAARTVFRFDDADRNRT
ncbi:MAG: ribosome maturation factor RimP [Clostridia bacterium]|nr:ribosome maturation factor RimP [Clostridia bacterium]